MDTRKFCAKFTKKKKVQNLYTQNINLVIDVKNELISFFKQKGDARLICFMDKFTPYTFHRMK